MRIAVCGPHKDEVISKVEESFNSQAKIPWSVNGKSTIIDYASETYKYWNERNVVFSGSPFDFLVNEPTEGYDDVYENIALDSLSNVNYIVVITRDMDKETLKMYEEYSKMFPDKFKFYIGYTDFELVTR